MQHCKFSGCSTKSWAKGYCSRHYYYAQRHGLLPRPKCSVAECAQPSFRKGLCNTHHIRAERHGSPLVQKKLANGSLAGKICTIDACEKPQRSNQMCGTHARRMSRYGDPLATPKRLGNGQATEERKRENRARAMKAYAQTPYGRMRSRFNSAKRRILAGATTDRYIDKDEFLKLWNTKTCGICMSELDDRTKSIDHVIPLARGGDNTMANLQMAHLICNQKKNRFMEHKWPQDL